MEAEILTNPAVLQVIQDGLEKGILEICARVRTEASSIAPTNKKGNGGRLRKSIIYNTRLAKTGSLDGVPDSGFMEGYVGSNVHYAPYVEFGTRKMPPQPYLRPAIAIYALGQKAADVLKQKQEENARGELKPENIKDRQRFGL